MSEKRKNKIKKDFEKKNLWKRMSRKKKSKKGKTLQKNRGKENLEEKDEHMPGKVCVQEYCTTASKVKNILRHQVR